MKQLFKALYESEINIQLSWFWDNGFDVKIGSEFSGFVEQFNSHDIDEIERWIVESVKKRFPNSIFAKTWQSDQQYIPKGDIEGFPIQVVKLMLKRQKEQTGKEDVSVFEFRNTATKCGGGFDWNKTEEGHIFWYSVICHGRFDKFFERYPN